MRANSYDLVCNGYEAASGSVRVHDSKTQARIFELLNIKAEEAEARFGFFLDAAPVRAPPHAGVALRSRPVGDAVHGGENIRDVIALPEDAEGGGCNDVGAPSVVDFKQLRDLRIKIDIPAK